jgi:hypothetical protein
MGNYDDLLNNNAPAEEQNGAPQLSREEYAAKMKAEREGVFALSDKAAQEVAADGGKFEQFLNAQARLDRYSAVNALLAFAQNPAASRLGDFDHWKRQSCSVRPGQKAISILEPREYTKDDGAPGMGYNVKKVFDISQVDTRKLRNTPPPRYGERQLLRALVDKAPVTITGVDELSGDLGAAYDPETDTISVLKGMEFADSFRAVAQELAFADLTTGPDTQADPHFSAHCASYLLCKKYGVDTKGFSFESAPDVLAGMNAQEVKGELSQIRDAAEDISGRMGRQLEAQQKAAKSQDAR